MAAKSLFPSRSRRNLLVIASVASTIAWLDADAAQPFSAPPATHTQVERHTLAGPTLLRRLTEEQYRSSITDIFGADIEVTGRFEPIVRPERGLIATATAQSTISPAGFEQYYKMARGIASQVVDKSRRQVLLSCRPKSESSIDDACATTELRRLGRLIFRRPLNNEELSHYVKAARVAAEKLGNFYEGLGHGIAAMLIAPEFLMRIELSEPDPDQPGGYRLNAYSKATRLSYLLWNSTPDEPLLQAADTGELHTPEGLARHAERLIRSPRLHEGIRAFFKDMLAFERFEDLQKDPIVYPQFNVRVAADMSEQLLRTITDHVIDRDADYRDLFTTNRTFVTRAIGVVQRIPVDPLKEWVAIELPSSIPSAGILSHGGFAAVYSHPGRSSPTLRGKAIRELLLCQKVPDPPGNVDFAVVNDTSNQQFKTARGRLSAHANDPSCVGCHRFIDPIGLALEAFDSIGAHRVAENESPIDTSGELDGKVFRDVAEFGHVLREHPNVPDCLVERLVAYASGLSESDREDGPLNYLKQQFANDGYRVVPLLRRIALSQASYRIRVPDSTNATAADQRRATPNVVRETRHE